MAIYRVGRNDIVELDDIWYTRRNGELVQIEKVWRVSSDGSLVLVYDLDEDREIIGVGDTVHLTGERIPFPESARSIEDMEHVELTGGRLYLVTLEVERGESVRFAGDRLDLTLFELEAGESVQMQGDRLSLVTFEVENSEAVRMTGESLSRLLNRKTLKAPATFTMEYV